MTQVTLKINLSEWKLIPKRSKGIHASYAWLFLEIKIDYKH
jgi:hypothetical protein